MISIKQLLNNTLALRPPITKKEVNTILQMQSKQNRRNNKTLHPRMIRTIKILIQSRRVTPINNDSKIRQLLCSFKFFELIPSPEAAYRLFLKFRFSFLQECGDPFLGGLCAGDLSRSLVVGLQGP